MQSLIVEEKMEDSLCKISRERDTPFAFLCGVQRGNPGKFMACIMAGMEQPGPLGGSTKRRSCLSRKPNSTCRRRLSQRGAVLQKQHYLLLNCLKSPATLLINLHFLCPSPDLYF